MPQIILASSSIYRKELLQRLFFVFLLLTLKRWGEHWTLSNWSVQISQSLLPQKWDVGRSSLLRIVPWGTSKSNQWTLRILQRIFAISCCPDNMVWDISLGSWRFMIGRGALLVKTDWHSGWSGEDVDSGRRRRMRWMEDGFWFWFTDSMITSNSAWIQLTTW